MVVVPGDSRFVAAFATVSGASKFLRQVGERQWEFKLVGRGSFHEMVGDLRRWGLVGLCFDPAGKKRKVTFDEVEQTP